MRNWLFAALGAVGLLVTGVNAATASPSFDGPMMRDRSPPVHAAPPARHTGYEWQHHRYQHRRWAHNHWHYWN